MLNATRASSDAASAVLLERLPAGRGDCGISTCSYPSLESCLPTEHETTNVELLSTVLPCDLEPHKICSPPLEVRA